MLTYINEMLDLLYQRDSFLLSNDVTERAITHRMGMYLQILLNGIFDVDCEYNRMGKMENGYTYFTEGDYFAKTVCLSGEMVSDESDVGSRVYPDIIVHKRGTAENSIIIEVKVAGKIHDKHQDIKKLIAYKKDLKYDYAFYIELFETRESVRIMEINDSYSLILI